MSRSKTINEPKNSASHFHKTPFETYYHQEEENEDHYGKTFDQERFSEKQYQAENSAVVPPLLSYRAKENNFICYQR